MKKNTHLLLFSILIFSSGASYAKHFNSVNVIPNEFESAIPADYFTNTNKNNIQKSAHNFIESGDYISVFQHAKDITERKNTECNEDGCSVNSEMIMSNFEIGAMQKGFIDQAKKDNISYEKANDDLFSILEKVNEEDNDFTRKQTALINVVSDMKEKTNISLQEITQNCRTKNTAGEDIFYCVMSQSSKENNIFLNMKLKCYESLLQEGMYEHSTVSRFLGNCINEEMSNEKFKRWSGYQFYQIGAVLYQLKAE